MNISRIAISLTEILLFGCCGTLRAQIRQTREAYIDRYKHIAIDTVELFGIPATTPMDQGLLDSNAG